MKPTYWTSDENTIDERGDTQASEILWPVPPSEPEILPLTQEIPRLAFRPVRTVIGWAPA